MTKEEVMTKLKQMLPSYITDSELFPFNESRGIKTLDLDALDKDDICNEFKIKKKDFNNFVVIGDIVKHILKE